MVLTSPNTSPFASGERRCLNTGRAVSAYYCRDLVNEGCEQTHVQHSVSILLGEAPWLLKWKPAEGEPRERQIHGPAVWLVPYGTPYTPICLAKAERVMLLIERDFVEDIMAGSAADVALVGLPRLLGQDDLIGPMTKIFGRLCQGSGFANPLYLESIATILGAHLLRALRAVNLTLEQNRGLPEDSLQRVTRYIDDHVNENLSMAVLGRAAGFSPSHFGHLFKTSLGLSPHHYVMRRRVAKAEELLRTTPMKEIEIAMLCGFSDDTLMARWFRRLLNCRPSDVRRPSH